MDLQKLRPTYSQWRAPLGPVPEGRAWVQPPAPAKQVQPPPKGKGNELWQRFYNDAVARGHPLPEKLADTLLRSRERTLELEAKKHKLLVTDKKPKLEETAVVNKTAAAKKRAVIHEALRCKAKTLEGRQCGFKSTCGEFCKRHAVEKM
jgi:hypothetical protein